MRSLVELILVATLALMLVPYSFANEWVSPDVTKAFQQDTTGSMLIAQKGRIDDFTDIQEFGRKGTNSAVRRSSLSEWVPFDIIRTWVLPFDP